MAHMVHLDAKGWRRSSRSGGNGQCVELHWYGGGVRDSKHPGAVLVVPQTTLNAMTEAVKAGKIQP